MPNDNSPPARSPYVAIPRDLGADPAYRDLSRDAQWLLMRLELDSYRLKCGVLALNDRALARDARASMTEVGSWLDELTACGWLEMDNDTGECWLTRHMLWDNTLANSNHAKAVLRDVKRVQSVRLARMVEKYVYSIRDDLAPIDPGWMDRNGIPEGESNPGNRIPESENDSGNLPSHYPPPEHDPRPPQPTPGTPGPIPPTPEPAPGARASAKCEKCSGTGLVHGKRGEPASCTCETGRHLKVVG